MKAWTWYVYHCTSASLTRNLPRHCNNVPKNPSFQSCSRDMIHNQWPLEQLPETHSPIPQTNIINFQNVHISGLTYNPKYH